MKTLALGRIGGGFGLGQITDAQVNQANAQLDAVGQLIGHQTRTIDDARRAGVPQALVDQLAADRLTSLSRLQSLSDRLGVINEENFRGWIKEARRLQEDTEGQMVNLSQQLATTGVSDTRMKISVATVLTLSVVGLGMVWLWQKAR